jgi:hypothetical protein
MQSDYSLYIHLQKRACAQIAAHEVSCVLTTLALQEAGACEYLVKGSGTPPPQQPMTDLSSLVNVLATRCVTFRNPFDEQVAVHVSFHPEGASCELSLPNSVLQNMVVQPRECLSMPVQFNPSSMNGSQGNLHVDVQCSFDTQPVLFVFPIEGSVETDTIGKLLQFTTKARHRLEELVSLQLTGLTGVGGDDKFTAIIVPKDSFSAEYHNLSASVVRSLVL